MAQSNKGRGGKSSGGGPNNRPMNQEREAKSKCHTGTVRAVPSGDTISILQVDPDGTNKEFLFGLLGLKAPSLGRRANPNKPDDKDVHDENWAWQSREFLREKLIGKAVVFRVEYTTEGGKRNGEVWLGQEDIRQTVIKSGWATVPPRRDQQGNQRPVSKEDQALVNLQEEAKGKGLGIYKKFDNSSVRKINYRDFSDQKKESVFFDKNKGQKKKAIVEQVKNGSQVRVYMPDSGDELLINLSGVRCPEKFSGDSKFFTEHKLLHRTVTLILDCIDKYNYYGTILNDQGQNIALGLLEFGLAQVVDWNLPSNSEASSYHNAELIAKKGNLRVWQNYNPAKNQPQNQPAKSAITGRVIEVNSLGTITLQIKDNNKPYEEKVQFSSIKVPRLPLREKLPERKDFKKRQQGRD
jgi:staphylococcal nuclease domain-containing protein 1